ncbi:hypothetical protein MGYG_02417 [Nannizzia gypsea CBS 118893]|uniref:Uncharacterized protein n=1 Tax=Arthroderma gypseum (strain ATCC MYA-4604 / CBS 118893) TaxID=535722 RepID=E4URI3_ARTGP|nr:hypothetical protein MGYG_02417 [Nannizzia gypsea CBS 118893]EFQ99405.1 hypothetical protein MGYG_02417 [Nannizzia gypsea CBS 118893]
MKISIGHRRKELRVKIKLKEPSFVEYTLDMSWYDCWLSQQLLNLPRCIKDLKVMGDSPIEKPHLYQLYNAIEDFLQTDEGLSIDEITQHLRKSEILEYPEALLPAQKFLVFAILGWRSMLYQASFNTCSTKEFAIHRESDQPQSGLVFDTYKVSAHLSDRSLWILLKAFGNILPARSVTAPQLASESSKIASSWLPLYPSETNAYLLTVLLGVRIRWVEMLALHLDYDKSTKTLSLFNYPSFCLHTLSSGGVIYSFESLEKYGVDPRANKEEISHFLREVLLSYRLIFGQSAKSRKLFRQLSRSQGVAKGHVDSVLPLLCTRKQLPFMQGLEFPVDKAVYFAAQDFPILHERIEIIAKELRDKKPTSVADLIRDRRDTLQFLTFWLVLIIGGIGTLLSLIQVILQAVQLIKS